MAVDDGGTRPLRHYQPLVCAPVPIVAPAFRIPGSDHHGPLRLLVATETPKPLVSLGCSCFISVRALSSLPAEAGPGRALLRGVPAPPRDFSALQAAVLVFGGETLAECGAIQLRFHKDGSRELGSLVVDVKNRNRGIASRLITSLLARHECEVFMITGRRMSSATLGGMSNASRQEPPLPASGTTFAWAFVAVG